MKVFPHDKNKIEGRKEEETEEREKERMRNTWNGAREEKSVLEIW